MNDLQRQRLGRAQEALNEAHALRDEGMDISFILNNLYLAYYYPILALVFAGQVPETMQSVTIGLFEQQFVRSGKVDQESFGAVRRMFELKPKCTGDHLLVAPDELDRLFHQAGQFIARIEELVHDSA